ncbi:MAG: histidine kinase [Gemmatimonadales bacterium]|nr:histidine kinase [Gemmatimonadales bacterium]
MTTPRPWIWLQLAIGWLPIWALYTMMIVAAHPGSDRWRAVLIAQRAIAAAAVLGVLVYRTTRRFPWPERFRLRFLGIHLVGATLYSVAWIALTSAIESVLRGAVVIVVSPSGPLPSLVLGVWLYVMVAGVAYASQATERAARAEALAARSQLAALRAQLNPHFLFNALHTVVHLIPREPKRAAAAAERVAGLLRTAVEEDRDLVPLTEEWAFVERYLDVERIRFGDRLVARMTLAPGTERALVPSFSLQTLVENAVRHGATPRMEATTIEVDGRRAGSELIVSVRDDGVGADPAAIATRGTGLRRLRDRLAALWDDRGRLTIVTAPGGGFVATLTVPFLDDAA